MADNGTNLELGVTADTSAATKDLRLVGDAVADLGDTFREISSLSAQAAKQLDKLERAVAGVSSGSKAAVKGASQLKNTVSGLSTEASNASGAMARLAAIKADTSNPIAQYTAYRGALKELKVSAQAARVELALLQRSGGVVSSGALGAAKNNGANPTPGARDYSNASVRNDSAIKDESGEARRINKAIAASMQERANAEDASTKLIEADSKARVDAYTKEYNAAKKIDDALARQSKEAATRKSAGVPDASRNKADGGQFAAQAAYAKQELADMGNYYRKLEADSTAAAKGNDSFAGSLTNARYALYDVSNSLAVGGAALLAFTGYTLNAAMTYETAMAQIQRTSGVSGEALEGVRSQFLELSQSIPTSFADISEIGTLAGQLNVAANQLADFTEVTAQFSTTTNVTAEAAATAFGRLDALLPDVQGNYAALGSSILTVGVNSVATESAIIATTNNIAAAGAQAGFTSDQVIGLAASYASLGVAPEAARGTTVRVFSEISDAIGENGAALDEYARLSDKTSSQFKTDWESNSGQAFVELLQGMQKAGEGTENLDNALRGLGITAVRDRNAMLLLAQNAEIVTDNFGYAADGFANTGALADAFGIQAETLASKLSMLVNTVQGFFGTLGESGTGPLGVFVDGLKGAVILLTNLAENPVAQWTAALAIGLTAVAGIALLLGAGLTRLGAAGLAAQLALTDLTAAAAGAGGGMKGLSVAMLGTSAAATGLKAALISTGIGALIVLAGTAVAAFDGLNKSIASASDVATERWGDSSGLSAALTADTEAAGANIAAMNTVTGTLTTNRETTVGWKGDIESATGAVVAAGEATTTTSQSVSGLTLAIGENSAAWLANKVANDESIASLFENSKKLTASGLDVTGFAAALATGDTKAANKIYDDFETMTMNRTPEQAVLFAKSDSNALEDMNKVLKSTEGALQNAANKTEVFNAVAQATGTQVNAAGDGLEMMGDAAEEATSSIDQMTDALAQAFAQDNVTGAFAADFYELAAGVYEAGASFNALDQAGQVNLGNLQASIGTTITAGSQMGLSATESVAVLFQQLQAMGIDTANLLAKIAKIPGLGIKAAEVTQYTSGAKAFTPAGNNMANSMKAMATNAKSAATQTRSAGSAAKAAAKDVQTLADYAGDLAKVFSRSFELRFGGQEALDKITLAYLDQAEAFREADENVVTIRKSLAELRDEASRVFSETYADEFASNLGDNLGDSIRDAFSRQAAFDAITTSVKSLSDALAESRTNINDLKATLEGLVADRAVKQYFLGVAQAYGDVLRAGTLGGELSANAASIAKAQADIAKETSNLSRELTGNSDAAIKNRADLAALAQQHADYLLALQASGAGTSVIGGQVARSKAQFEAQAKELGFTSDQLSAYNKLFDEFSLDNATAAVDANNAAQAAQAAALAEVQIKERELAVAIEATSRSLEGNSRQAIENRSAMYGIIQANQDYIVKLAANNASQNELRGAVNNLNNVFRDQYNQLGMNGQQTMNAIHHFEGLNLIISQLPRRVDIGTYANIDPAVAAMKEFYRWQSADMANRGGGVHVPVIVDGIGAAINSIGAVTGAVNGAIGANAQTSGNAMALQAQAGLALALGKFLEAGAPIGKLQRKEFKVGGYTGDVNDSRVAGVVHGKEFVIDAPNTKRLGIPFLNALNNGALPTAASSGSARSGGINVVELSAYDRKLLAAAGKNNLIIGDKVVATATNNSNLSASRLGSS